MAQREWCKEYNCWCNKVEENTKNQYVSNLGCLICEDCLKKEDEEQDE